MNIRKGDNIIVITGKDKGKTGKVVKSFPRIGKVVVEGINLRKRHEKPRKQGQKGQVIDVASPISVSNVSLIDPKTKKPTRVGYKIEAGKKTRISRKSGVAINN